MVPAEKLSRKSRIRMVDWSHLRSEFTWAYETEVSPLFLNTRQHHPGQSALLIQSGTLWVETEKGRLQATAGQWIFPSQGPRIQRFSEGARVLSVHFQINWAGGRPLFDWPVALVVEAGKYPLLEKRARDLIQRVCDEVPCTPKDVSWHEVEMGTYFRIKPGFDLWLCAYLDALTAEGCQPFRLGGIDSRMLQAVDILDDLAPAESITEKQLAAKIGLSLTQLNRLFISEFKLTPRQYLERKKLSRAEDLIENAPLSIKQIAYELGFGSLPAFSRWFRQKTGLAPRDAKQRRQRER